MTKGMWSVKDLGRFLRFEDPEVVGVADMLGRADQESVGGSEDRGILANADPAFKEIESARDLISALAERTAENGGGVVMVSHDTDQLRAACHRTMSLSSGRLETTA